MSRGLYSPHALTGRMRKSDRKAITETPYTGKKNTHKLKSPALEQIFRPDFKKSINCVLGSRII